MRPELRAWGRPPWQPCVLGGERAFCDRAQKCTLPFRCFADPARLLSPDEIGPPGMMKLRYGEFT